MKLYYSSTSPYSRKVLILIYELDLVDQVDLIRVNPFEDPMELWRYNPLGKVPTLVLDNHESLYDSSVITQYLQSLVDPAILLTEEWSSQKCLESLSDGIMDAAVSIVMEKRRPEEQQSSFWQERWTDTIMRSLKVFEEKYLDHRQKWYLGTIAMVCALDYLEFRLSDKNWKQLYPKTEHWFQRTIDKSSLKKTDPRGNCSPQ
ncbi:MAG: glutathione S-transferase N-terminal domain-containing protein [Microcystaceae cyanobacterium]